MIRPFTFRKKRAYGTATIPNGADHVEVAHGLGQVPTIVLVAGTQTEVSGLIYSADEDTITITASGAVSADRTVSWYAEV